MNKKLRMALQILLVSTTIALSYINYRVQNKKTEPDQPSPHWYVTHKEKINLGVTIAIMVCIGLFMFITLSCNTSDIENSEFDDTRSISSHDDAQNLLQKSDSYDYESTEY